MERSYESANNDPSVGSLIGGLIKDLQDLIRGEVQLAKAEFREDAASAGRAGAMVAGGALVGLTGFIFLMLALTYLLGTQMKDWIAAGIVGVALAVIAFILVMTGKNKLSATNLAPQRTMETLKEDKEWARQQINSVKR
jgi:uncharacterized membrane protein YqjE